MLTMLDESDDFDDCTAWKSSYFICFIHKHLYIDMYWWMGHAQQVLHIHRWPLHYYG